MTNLEKTLQDFANDFELLLKNKAYVADLIATGELMNTLEVSSYYVNNKEFKVIIDRKEGDYYIGRTQFDSPEVDPEVLIKADDEYLKIGEFYKVKITAADDFDLYASIL